MGKDPIRESSIREQHVDSPEDRINRELLARWLDKEFDPEKDIPQLARYLLGYDGVSRGHPGYSNEEAYPYLSRALGDDLKRLQKLAIRLAKMLEQISQGIKIKIEQREFSEEEENQCLYNVLSLTQLLLRCSEDLRGAVRSFDAAKLKDRIYLGIHLDKLLPGLLGICQKLDETK